MKFSLFPVLACTLVSTILHRSASAQDFPDAMAPKETINLLADPEWKGFVANVNPAISQSTDPQKIWSIRPDGTLRVVGDAMGYLRTKQAYRDYHLVLDYKWGERTWGARSDKARDNGLMLHAYGPDGAYGTTWVNSIEVNVFEGGTGEILVLAATDKNGIKAPTRVTAEVVYDPNGKPVWKQGGQKEVFPPADKRMSRINWRDQDPNWKDVKGFRGAKDIENPVGEWNRMEVICEGSTMRVFVNGQFVNEATDCYPSAGYVALQTEDAELWVRRYELHPLGTFKEKWEEEKRSQDIAFDSSEGNVLPRRFPLSPEESAKLWHIGGDYDLQLVASEPLTCDPVDLTWDEQGRMFVAEMGDYPLPVEDGTFLSRIRLLTDTDGDGVMDKAVTWANGLNHVNGLLRTKNGLIVTTHTQILFLADTDGDDVADKREVLFTVNAPIHGQLQISSPRYGLDNHIWISNGLQAKWISSGGASEEKTDITRLNLRYDPRSGTIAPATGAGQFGGTLDDWNRHYYCSNRNPLMVSVMPLEAVRRNPQAGILVGHEDALPAASPVHPLHLTHTTTPGEAGTFTAACGLSVYRGELMPDLAGQVLVCEPTAELISRNRLTPRGSGFSAETIENGVDFIVSGDEWTRPVQVRNGPDGAIYICDMYRRFIDHPIYFPKEFADSHYMRAGLDQGRIWRLVPEGSKAPAPIALPMNDVSKLATLLTSENGATRTEAQRLLVEKQDRSVVPALEKLLADRTKPKTQAHALWTLSGLGALKAEHLRPLIESSDESGLLENALQVAFENGLVKELAPAFLKASKRDLPRFRFLYIALTPDSALLPDSKTLAAWILASPEDPWLRKAIFSSVPQSAAAILTELLARDEASSLAPSQVAAILHDFSSLIAARGNHQELAALLSRLGSESQTRQLAIVSGLSDGLSRSSLPQHSLAELIAAQIPELGEGTSRLLAVLDRAADIALDTHASDSDRLSALDLVRQGSWESRESTASKLITFSESSAIQSAACRLLSSGDPGRIGDFFFTRWSTLPPAAKSSALDILVAHPTTMQKLMEEMKSGKINRGLMPLPARRNAERSGKKEIRSLAHELFTSVNDNRSAVVTDYVKKVGKLSGDPSKGAHVFEKAACITCHRIGDLGTEVGPSLNDVKIKHAEAIISDILDPNRVVEERWISQVVETTDGRSLAGLLAGADASAVTLRMAGGITTTVPKAEVKALQSTGISLMPEGLEQVISPEEMADLIAFLKKR